MNKLNTLDGIPTFDCICCGENFYMDSKSQWSEDHAQRELMGHEGVCNTCRQNNRTAKYDFRKGW